jgi:hypothetical protein
MPINSGMFSLVDRVVVNQLLAAAETNLFLPTLKCWYGFLQTTSRSEDRIPPEWLNRFLRRLFVHPACRQAFHFPTGVGLLAVLRKKTKGWKN